MSDERRFNEDEVAEILEKATAADTSIADRALGTRTPECEAAGFRSTTTSAGAGCLQESAAQMTVQTARPGQSLRPIR